jgi:hypothetical protein
MNLELTLEELKVIRVGLNKAPASLIGLDAIKKVDALLLENNLIYERTELPKVKYQKKAIVKYVFQEVK